MIDTSIVQNIVAGVRQSTLLRLLTVGVLTLVLLIPMSWIRELIAERGERRGEAIEEVVSKWGRTQTFTGPALIIPYERRRVEQTSDGKDVERVDARYLTILPDVLQVHAKVQSESRHRGIFVVPVYRAALDVTGEIAWPDLAALNVDPASVAWPRARLVVGVSDARALQNRAAVSWNGQDSAFQPGAGDIEAVPSGIHAPIADPFAAPRASFAFHLEANGSSSVYFAAAGQETSVVMESGWPSPSFQGTWLPAERTVDGDGFTATWRIPFLGRNQAQAWTTAVDEKATCLATSLFGVNLMLPVDAHRMSDRSVKYAQLFILLTFGAVWLLEVLARVRVHPVQYLMIGAALCTFYLLELSLAEQIGFELAYAVASLSIVSLVGSYSGFALRGWRRAGGVVGLMGGLYTYLYVVLTNEDYALMVGSIGLFIAVALTMLLTRRIDWYDIGVVPANGGA